MLHIILMILKIIGILILAVLALLLIIIGVVLFVPIRYRVNGKKDEESFFVKAEVYWLLHLFRLKALYPEPGRIVVKVLWFTVYDSGAEEESEKPKKEKKKKNRKAKEGKLKNKQEKKSEKSRNKTQNEAEKTEGKTVRNTIEENTKENTLHQKKAENIEETTECLEQPEQVTEETIEDEKGKIGKLIDKIKEILQKILDICKNIRYTITRFCDKIKEIWANIQYYLELFGEEETKRAFSMCKEQLYKIWKNIRPQKCMVDLKIGTGEPDTTGYILAVHGMLYPLIGNNVRIEPDFENQVMEGTVFIKGRITIFVLVCAAIKLYFDEDIRYFLKRFKREE